MIPALLTTVLWSYCVIAARKSVDQLGENLANVARIVLALFVLGILAHLFGQGIGGGGFYYFFLSGVIGFGLGDIGVFYALPRIGSRLTLLMSQCVAAPVAGFAEWIWMGTTISLVQMVAIVVILGGIVLALMPKNLPAANWPVFLAGIAFGLLAAFGQGIGAVLSRKAYSMAHLAGSWMGDQTVIESVVMGATSGYQRLIGGTLVLVVFYLLSFVIRPWRTSGREPACRDSLSNKSRFVVLTAATGPIFGIICFQWALATTPSVIVQPIVAMTPLAVMPLAWYFEGDRPRRLAVVGSVISVFGVVLLAFGAT